MLEAPAIHGPTYGLRGYYHGDDHIDGSGVIRDETTGNNHATIGGSVGFAAGYAGDSMTFDGSTAVVQLPTLGFGGSTSVSIAARFRLEEGSTQNRVVAGFGTPTSDFSFVLMTLGTSYLRFQTDNNLINIGSPGTNTWIHAVCVYDAATDERRFYRNGSLAASDTRASSFNDENYKIGGWNNNLYFDGKIDSVRYYNRALTQSEVTALYNGV